MDEQAAGGDDRRPGVTVIIAQNQRAGTDLFESGGTARAGDLPGNYTRQPGGHSEALGRGRTKELHGDVVVQREAIAKLERTGRVVVAIDQDARTSRCVGISEDQRTALNVDRPLQGVVAIERERTGVLAARTTLKKEHRVCSAAADIAVDHRRAVVRCD